MVYSFFSLSYVTELPFIEQLLYAMYSMLVLETVIAGKYYCLHFTNKQLRLREVNLQRSCLVIGRTTMPIQYLFRTPFLTVTYTHTSYLIYLPCKSSSPVNLCCNILPVKSTENHHHLQSAVLSQYFLQVHGYFEP